MRHLLAPLAALLLAACAAITPASPQPAAALLLGEQHDAAEHPRLHAQVIGELADRQQLAAVVIEMAPRGHGTGGLPADAGEGAVREALAWNEAGWPWAAYGPAVMAAVRAGVPVLGANLDAAEMREAMADAKLDHLLPPAALQEQRAAIRSGHCSLLPENRLPAMVRVQVARDRAMAAAVTRSLVRGKTVVLLAGAGHVDPRLGVPRHLAPTLKVEAIVLPPVATGKDDCAQLRP
jgi:uncharacterized iron-regulated protein